MPEQPIELEPILPGEACIIMPTARLYGSFAMIREALAQPTYSHDTGFSRDPELSRVFWQVRDRHSRAMLAVWDEEAEAPTPADTEDWLVWWEDGPGKPGSGRRMADLLIGEKAGGAMIDLM